MRPQGPQNQTRSGEQQEVIYAAAKELSETADLLLRARKAGLVLPGRIIVT